MVSDSASIAILNAASDDDMVAMESKDEVDEVEFTLPECQARAHSTHRDQVRPVAKAVRPAV